MSGMAEPEASTAPEASTTPEARTALAAPDARTTVGEIKRTSGPQTTNGKRWEVQLSASPTREWLDLFKTAPEVSSAMAPRRLDFDRGCAIFQSDEDHVKPWVEAIDRWIASTNARQRLNLEQVGRERADRLDADARQREHIQQMNDRFKDL